MSAVTRDSIFAAAKEMPFASVLVQAWGGAVRVYSMTAGERDLFDKETLRRRKNKEELRVRERLLIATVKTDDGQPLFTAADEYALTAQPASVVERPFNAAARMNGYIVEDDGDDSGN